MIDGPISASWDNATPQHVSYADHIKSLTLHIVEIFHSSGWKGCVKMSPVWAAMLSVVQPQHYRFRWHDGIQYPIEAGDIMGIPIWADPQVPCRTVLVAPNKDSHEPTGIIRIHNFDARDYGVLDQLANISED